MAAPKSWSDNSSSCVISVLVSVIFSHSRENFLVRNMKVWLLLYTGHWFRYIILYNHVGGQSGGMNGTTSLLPGVG